MSGIVGEGNAPVYDDAAEAPEPPERVMGSAVGLARWNSGDDGREANGSSVPVLVTLAVRARYLSRRTAAAPGAARSIPSGAGRDTSSTVRPDPVPEPDDRSKEKSFMPNSGCSFLR